MRRKTAAKSAGSLATMGLKRSAMRPSAATSLVVAFSALAWNVEVSYAFSGPSPAFSSSFVGSRQAFCSANFVPRSDTARQTLQLRMADENPAMNWLKKTLRENAGQNSDQKEELPQPKPDEASVSSASADFSFKFSDKFKEKFQDMDVEAALNSAVEAAPRPKETKEPAATPNIPGLDQRFYELTLDRPTGIEFATDLSLKFVYVMEVKDNSPAQLSVTPVEVGDQLCGINGEECIGEPFKDVAELLGKAPNKPLSFRFFRGSKQQLLDAVGREDYVPTEAIVKAIEPDGKESQATFRAGANLRDALVEEGVQVYNVQSGRFTNCNGKQLCGTCIVDVLQGAEYTNDKSIDEDNFLRKMPPTYRLSCCVQVYGDIIVKTRPRTGKKFIEFS